MSLHRSHYMNFVLLTFLFHLSLPLSHFSLSFISLYFFFPQLPLCYVFFFIVISSSLSRIFVLSISAYLIIYLSLSIPYHPLALIYQPIPSLFVHLSIYIVISSTLSMNHVSLSLSLTPFDYYYSTLFHLIAFLFTFFSPSLVPSFSSSLSLFLFH